MKNQQALRKIIFYTLALAFAAIAAPASTYNVGPGQTLTNLSSVPWGGLPIRPGVCIGPLLVSPVASGAPGPSLTEGAVID